MDADPERSGISRLVMFSDCVRYAANRLLIHDLLRRPRDPPGSDRTARDRGRPPALGHDIS
jgi:hypothetical protein